MARIIRKLNPALPQPPRLLNVAAYARVSLDKDTMLHSLSAQVSYYRRSRVTPVGAMQASTRTKQGRAPGIPAAAGRLPGREDRHGDHQEHQRICPQYGDAAGDGAGIESAGRGRLLRGTEYSLHEWGWRADAEHPRFLCAGGIALGLRNCTWRVRKKFEAGIPTTAQILGYRIKRGDFEIIRRKQPSFG